MKRIVLFLSATALFLTGCYNTHEHPIFRVKTDATAVFNIPTENRPKLAIRPFADNRGNFRLDNIGVAYIPGFPVGWSKFDRVEDRYPNYFAVSASDDLTRATADCFLRSGLFQSVSVIKDGERTDADYVLTGSIENMRYSRTYFTYGYSILAGMCWAGAAPVNASMQRLDLRLSLRDRTGKEVWQWMAQPKDQMAACVQGAYYCKYTYRMYGRIFLAHINHALTGLHSFLMTHPVKQAIVAQPPITSAVQKTVPQPTITQSVEMNKLKQLRESGAITQEEYERLSKRLSTKTNETK